MRRTVPLLVAVTVVALASLSLGGLLSPPAGAHPPPEPFCGACTEGFEDAADHHGTFASVSESELDLRVHENATVTGVARMRVNVLAADRFRENESLLDAVARDAFAGAERDGYAGHSPVRNVQNIEASLDGRTVRVAFEMPDAATAGVGDVVYTDLLRGDGTGGIRFAVDAVRFDGPDGTTVSRVPGGGSTDGSTAFWRASEDEYLADEGYVAWSDGGVGGVVATTTSIWFDEAATTYPRVTVASALAVGLAAALCGLLVLVGPRLESVLAQPLNWLVVAYAAMAPVAFVTAIVLFVLRISDILALATLALAPGAVAVTVSLGVLALRTTHSRRALGRLPTGAMVALPLVLGLALVAGVASPLTVAILTAAGALPIVGVLGVASVRGRRPTIATSVAFALIPVCVTFASDAATPFGEPAVVAWVLLVVLAGVPLFALGRRSGLAADAAAGGTPTDHATSQR